MVTGADVFKPNYAQLVPSALLRSLCALSGHMAHTKDPETGKYPACGNLGALCLPEAEYERLVLAAARPQW